MWFSLISLGIISLLLHLIYKRISNSNSKYWAQYGIRQVDASAAASNLDVLLGKKDVSERDTLAYNLLALSGEGFCGMIESSYKVILLKDLELAKKILIKDFDNFPYRRDFFAFAGEDSILKKMLSSVNGEDWRDLRNTLSPTFTTGKIRKYMESFNSVGKEWVAALTTRAGNSNGSLDIDVIKSVNQFTVDVVASAVFGMKAGTVHNPDSEFAKFAYRFGDFNRYKMALGMQLPKLAQFLQLEVVDMKALNWFKAILNDGLQQRMQGGPKYNDFLQLLADAKKGELKAATEDELGDFEKEAMVHLKPGKKILLSDEVLNAQSLLFFLAGLSGTTNLITFAMYALSAYPEVQEKLRKEVDTIAKENGDIDYDELAQLPYMEMFICEVLRMYPAVTRLERICINDFKEPDSGLFIPKDTLVTIPVKSIHMDPNYYESPEKFDPELHFSPEKKAGRSPYTYIPFGVGPRNCIGMRFALIEGKAGVAHLVHNFVLKPTAKTPIPIQYDLGGLQILPPKGLELKVTPRPK